MSKKRRREQPAVDTQLVEIYEDLADVDENVRLKAAETLLTKFVANGKPTGEQLNEIVRRLFRGLCSGRKAARLGFSVVLTELLTELFDPNGNAVAGGQTVLELIETLKKQSQASSNVSGQVRSFGMSSIYSLLSIEQSLCRKSEIISLDDFLERNLLSSQGFCSSRSLDSRLGTMS